MSVDISTIKFTSIATAGEGVRELHLERAQLGEAVGLALAGSRTKALRLTKGLISTAADTDQKATEVHALVEWAAREGSDQRTVVAEALRTSGDGGEILLVDRIARLPRTEARAFVADWLGSGGDMKAAIQWLATIGGVLRKHPEARPVPGESGAVVEWISNAVEDVVDAIVEAVETIVDAVVSAGEALADALSAVAQWTVEQVGNLAEALLEAGRTIGQLVTDAFDAGVTVFKKFVQALVDIGRTVAEVIRTVALEAIGALRDAVRALIDIAVTVGDILRDAVALAAATFRRVVEALIDIGRSVVQIMRAAWRATLEVMRATVRALLEIGRTLDQLIVDVVTGEVGLVEAFVRAARDIGRSVRNLLDAASTAVTGALRTIARSLLRIGSTIVDLAEWAAGAAASFAREIVRAIRDIGTTVATLFQSIATRAARVFRAMVDGLFAIGGTLATLLRDLATVTVDLLAKVLEAAFSLGVTIANFAVEALRSTYKAARRLVAAAIKAGAAVAELLVEAARGTYFALRKMIVAVADAVGLGDIMRWAADRLERLADNVFHSVLTALRYAGQQMRQVLDWVVDKSQEIFDAVVDAWESIREDLIDLYRWAATLTGDLLDRAWEGIGKATVKFRNSISYVFDYLEHDFLPGAAKVVRGLFAAGLELAALAVRLAGRSVAFITEVIREVVSSGVTIARLLAEYLRNPRASLDDFVRAVVQELGRSWSDLFRDAADGLIRELVDTSRRLGESVREVLEGAFEVLGGMVSTAVSQFMLLINSVRPLTAAEREAAELVFADSISLDDVMLSQESPTNAIIFGPQDFFNGNPNSRAFVTGNLINYDVGDGITIPTLIHELTHVWQQERTGPVYMADAILAQTVGSGYQYGNASSSDGSGGEAALRAAGGDFSRFNPEQQGQIVMHYYVRRYERSLPEADWADWQPYIDVVRAA